MLLPEEFLMFPFLGSYTIKLDILFVDWQTSYRGLLRKFDSIIIEEFSPHNFFYLVPKLSKTCCFVEYIKYSAN